MPKSFFDNPVKKNLTVAGVLRINIWLFIPVPKIKFDPSPQGKMLWGLYFRYFIKLTIFFKMWKFHQKIEFC